MIGRVMHLTAEHRYEASPEQVFRMLCDEAFRVKVCEATYALSHQVSVQREGDATTVRVRRVLPAKVPDAFKRFVGHTLPVVQTERWGPMHADGSRTADVTIEVEGKPARMTGTTTLAPTPSGSIQQMQGALRASVPLLGRRIEEAAARPIRRGFEIEGELGRQWLAAQANAG